MLDMVSIKVPRKFTHGSDAGLYTLAARLVEEFGISEGWSPEKHGWIGIGWQLVNIGDRTPHWIIETDKPEIVSYILLKYF